MLGACGQKRELYMRRTVVLLLAASHLAGGIALYDRFRTVPEPLAHEWDAFVAHNGLGGTLSTAARIASIFMPTRS